MGKRKVGALEKVDADLYILIIDCPARRALIKALAVPICSIKFDEIHRMLSLHMHKTFLANRLQDRTKRTS